MAKKSAVKKKKIEAVKKASKQSKSVLKTAVKAVKKVAKAIKLSATKPAAKPAKVQSSAKPALMTKKGKAEIAEDPITVVEKKTKTIVSLIEAEAVVDSQPAKAEKVSKIKPVKVERGNLADEKAKWAELFKKYGKEKASTYKMTEQYSSLMPLQHKVLGWGFVLTNENDRLEVLFENGIRMLISNYKS